MFDIFDYRYHQGQKANVVSLWSGSVVRTGVRCSSGRFLSSRGGYVGLINMEKANADDAFAVVAWPEGLEDRWQALAVGRYHWYARWQGSLAK